MKRHDHERRQHVYHHRRNPSGCDKFYCLRRFRPIYYLRLTWGHAVRNYFGGSDG